jgi:hypothetical protein
MKFIKHVGKHGDRKVAIIYRKVPGEDHMALVIYPDLLPTAFHNAVMQVIESDPGQQSIELADALGRNLLPDGRQILATLHKEGKIKKVATNQIIITPNAQSHIRLDELNKITTGIEQGNDASKKMADLDANSGFVDPAKKAIETVSNGVLDNAAIATDLLNQSKKMVADSKALIAEGKRLEQEAFALDPKLKPRRAAKKTDKAS